MAYQIDIDDQGLARRLALGLAPAVEAGAMGIAASIQNEVAPYPPAPPRRPGKPYYVRGRGGFTASGIQVSRSELLNRRWSIKSLPFGARLRNTASYAGKVHGRRQARMHGKRGWVKITTGIETVLSSGEAQRIMLAAIANVLRKR